MNKIREIIKKVGIEGDLSEIPSQYLHERIINAVMEFGEVCFEAGRENKTKYNPTKDGKLYQISIIPEFKTYEDFLKEIEDET